MSSVKIQAGEFAVLAVFPVSEKQIGATAGEGSITSAFRALAEARPGEFTHIMLDPAIAHVINWRTEPRID